MRFSAGIFTSFSSSSATGMARIPILSSSFAMRTPGIPFSTMKALRRRDFDSGSVTAKTAVRSATPPPVFHFFSPLRIQAPSFSTPRVCWFCASDPASFSERPKEMSFSPFAMRGSQRCFCSSVPPTRIGKEPRAFTAKPTPMPPHARESSSTTMQRLSRRWPPAPPYSSGIQTLSSPSAARRFVTSRGYSWIRSCFQAAGRTTSSASFRARSRQ